MKSSLPHSVFGSPECLLDVLIFYRWSPRFEVRCESRKFVDLARAGVVTKMTDGFWEGNVARPPLNAYDFSELEGEFQSTDDIYNCR